MRQMADVGGLAGPLRAWSPLPEGPASGPQRLRVSEALCCRDRGAPATPVIPVGTRELVASPPRGGPPGRPRSRSPATVRPPLIGTRAGPGERAAEEELDGVEGVAGGVVGGAFMVTVAEATDSSSRRARSLAFASLSGRCRLRAWGRVRPSWWQSWDPSAGARGQPLTLSPEEAGGEGRLCLPGAQSKGRQRRRLGPPLATPSACCRPPGPTPADQPHPHCRLDVGTPCNTWKAHFRSAAGTRTTHTAGLGFAGSPSPEPAADPACPRGTGEPANPQPPMRPAGVQLRSQEKLVILPTSWMFISGSAQKSHISFWIRDQETDSSRSGKHSRPHGEGCARQLRDCRFHSEAPKDGESKQK
ncbi:uncharacterized protein LOC115280933 [Suricata suricatta]|uniref:uncharacterized protein LOC115280933 n=1 Tax=Suricata suricatta TaxID=37032 RepID=UPI0011553F74|nr:uncharacterized protein LOC115280933 [Suricata suricatta]